MSYLLKQSATERPLLFPLISSSDHIAPLTGATPTVTLSKNGAAFAAPAGAVTEVGSGWYAVAANATDTGTLGVLILHATASGADPTDVQYEVVAFDPQSATNLGLSNLDATVSSRNAGNVTVGGYAAGEDPATLTGVTPTVAGRLDVAVSTRLAASAYTAPDTGATIAADVLNATAASYDTAGSIGAKINAAGTASDPWATALPGSYGAGTAGSIIGTNVDAKTSTRATPAQILATPANLLTTNASGQVQHDMTQAVPSTPTQGTVGDALLAAEAQGVGKWTINGTTLTLYRHDGTTVVRTFTLDSASAPTARS